MNQPFETFLLELAKVLKFSTLAPDSQGACMIVMSEWNASLLFEFDDQLVPNTVLLSSPIASIPIAHCNVVCEAALIGNTHIEETLSLKPDEDLLYLHRRFHPLMEASDIEKLLTMFLETLKTWREHVEVLIKQPPAGTFPSFPIQITLPPHIQ
jgi:hypothetical protein